MKRIRCSFKKIMEDIRDMNTKTLLCAAVSVTCKAGSVPWCVGMLLASLITHNTGMLIKTFRPAGVAAVAILTVLLAIMSIDSVRAISFFGMMEGNFSQIQSISDKVAMYIAAVLVFAFMAGMPVILSVIGTVRISLDVFIVCTAILTIVLYLLDNSVIHYFNKA